MSGQEAQFTTLFRRWARDNMWTGAYEIKHTRGEQSFRMSEWHEHQRDALEAVASRVGLAYKIPDDGVAHKPFDMFVLKGESAFVVIAYPGQFVVIEAGKLAAWKYPSLPFTEAKAMASMCKPLRELTL